jgi:Asp-tRNA(Asn)/Glu-tRNA(Gln) amidotransferase A subunit family amidase
VRRRHEELRARVERHFADADLWVTPTVPILPPKVGSVRRDDPPARTFAALAPLGAFTAPFNISGQPAATLPAAVSSSGLPIGVQLVGRLYDDATVLGASRQLEEELGRLRPSRHPRDRGGPFLDGSPADRAIAP